MTHTHQLQLYWEDIVHRLFEQEEEKWLHKKVKGLMERGRKISRITFHVKPYHRLAYERKACLHYLLTLSILIKDGRHYYLEEGIYHGHVDFVKDKIQNQSIITEPRSPSKKGNADFIVRDTEEIRPFSYDRRAAVRYAERWWDSHNPDYQHFEEDCTNFISQCLRAGGSPLWGSPQRTRGWWYTHNNWSYSWSVANALRWYLSGSRKGLIAKEVSSADQLSPGDIICYDFQGDGSFDHNTIVVKKDTEGMPLVNAHTTNSRHRYWAYEDSTAYTPEIKYKFYVIGG